MPGVEESYETFKEKSAHPHIFHHILEIYGKKRKSAILPMEKWEQQIEFRSPLKKIV